MLADGLIPTSATLFDKAHYSTRLKKHPPLTELITSHRIDTIGHEVLQPKGPLNPKAIEHIVTLELRQKATGASSSTMRAPRAAHPTQTCATITYLTQAIERHEAQLHGMRNWMGSKAADDHHMG